MATANINETKFKLHYFNLRGKGECIRFIFCYAGQEFEDFRIDLEKWRSRDESVPFSLYLTKSQQVPVLQVAENGKVWSLSQSLAIARYLARRFGLTGANEQEAAECDEIADALEELLGAATRAYYSGDDEQKHATCDKLLKRDYPRVLGSLERRLVSNGGKHLVGNQWTWADFTLHCILHNLRDYAETASLSINANYPTLVQLAKSVAEIPQIADHIAKRPATDR